MNHMHYFTLYRVKVERSQQLDMFDQLLTSSQIVYQAALEQPSYETRKGQNWKIGNFEKIDDNGFVFALGKITNATVEKYDERHKEFKEEIFEQAPYTYVFLDLANQVCAIAKKTKISNDIDSIAQNLEILLNKSNVAKKEKVTFNISQISEPAKFIEILRNAKAINEFKITFTRPNPVDVESMFVKPMENYTQAINAVRGETTVQGDNLNADVAERLALSAASTGDDACAKVLLEHGKRFVKRHLRGNSAVLTVINILEQEDKINFLNLIRETYKKIRRNEGS